MCNKLKRSKCCVTVLLWLQILAGVVLLCMTMYFHCILIALMPKTERQLLLSQMSNIYLLSFELLICFSVGFILWRRICKNGDTITENSRLLILLNSFCTLVVVCGSMTVWFQYSNIESLQIAYEASLFQGIDLYFTDPEWKLLWDEIQFRNQCCGVFGFKDWEEAAWIPDEQEDCLQISELSHSMIMIPYACCKHSAASCFEKFTPHTTNVKDLYNDLNDINLGGCCPKFKILTLQFSHTVFGIWVFSLTTQICLLVLIPCIILRSKQISFGLVCSEETDERPLVVVKYPRNVRCITLTDEDTFGDEEEEEEGFKKRCSNCLTEVTSVRQDIFDTCNGRQNIFVH